MTAEDAACRREQRARKAAGTSRPVGPPHKPIEHGQRKGAAQHRRRGETPCDACRLAENEDRRRLRDAGGKTRG